MGRSSGFILVFVGLALWLGSMSVFIVDERELAIKFRLGEIQRSYAEPGIYGKLPFINNVRKFERRLLTLQAEQERYLTLEKKNVIVDAFIKWRIDPAAVENYYRTMGGDERRAETRLAQIIKDGLRSEFGKRTIQEAISGERAEIMNIITTEIKSQVDTFGVEVVDVRIKRIELTPDVSNSVYARMEAERARVAKELRSRGAEAAERIKADSDRQRTVILAEAYRDSEYTRGEGDAKAAEIYAQAFQKNAQFYSFYRSLNAYQDVFNKPEDVLVLDPESEFFQFFKNSSGK